MSPSRNDVLPVEVLRCFSRVIIFTYLFEGSEMAAYLQANGVAYEMTTLDQDRQQVPHDPRYDAERLAGIRHLIRVTEDPWLNSIGEKTGREHPLSKTWLETAKDAGGAKLDQLKGRVRKFFETRAKTPSHLNLWSTFKDFRTHLAGKGWSRGFLHCNAKATNDYRHKTAAAYLVNLFLHPTIRKYYEDRGCTVSPDFYALATMVQWVWRTAIRDGQAIDLYIPSRRMRGLFMDFLNGKLPPPTLGPAQGTPSGDFSGLEMSPAAV